MNRIQSCNAAVICLGLGLITAATEARASNGTVTGRVVHYQNQGNFCPVGRDCTGAKYVQAQYGTYQPVREVKVYLRRSPDGAPLGEGFTDGNGYFTIFWSDWSTSGNVTANFDWRGEQKDNKFHIIDDPSGQRWSFWTWPITLVNGATSNFGEQRWGQFGAPHQVTNLYDGAAMMWINSLGQTNRMWNHFNNVVIRSNTPGTFATPWDNSVHIGWDTHFEGFVVMHELGHVASYKASRDQNFGGPRSYCFPGTGGSGCDHSFESEEWAHASFEEGTATALTVVGLYYPWATQPQACRSNSACGAGVNHFENSIGNASCTVSHARRENNVTRYHWDNYDTVSDFPGEDLQRGVWEIVDTLHAFDNGTGGLQKDEHWGSDFDGRSARDFEFNWFVWGTTSWDELTNNCLDRVGDL